MALDRGLSFAAFLAYERRAAQPMLKLDLFKRRNFAVGNLETLTMYAGLAILFFFLTIFLQQAPATPPFGVGWPLSR